MALNTMSATPPEPCERWRTANLSRYGTRRGEGDGDGGSGEGGVSHVRIAAPSYSPAMMMPAREVERRAR